MLLGTKNAGSLISRTPRELDSHDCIISAADELRLEREPGAAGTARDPPHG
jgi:hypothetical protein